MPIILTYGVLEETTFTLPIARDDDYQVVTIDIDMDDIDHFAIWDQVASSVIFKLV